MVDTIDEALRENNVLNDPGSGKYKPLKGPIRRILKRMEANAAAGVIHKATRALLLAITPPTENYGGMVYADPTPAYNGQYVRTGAAWVWARPLPYAAITLTNVGAGTPAAIAATSDVSLPLANARAVYFLNIADDNIGPDGVTLEINEGAAKALKTIGGTSLPPGTLVAGMIIMFSDNGSEYRLLSALGQSELFAPAAESSAARAELAQDAAELARDASFALGPKYADEATGRAAVADGAAFLVQGAGSVAAIEYRRTSSTVSVEIARYPSARAVDAIVSIVPLIEGWRDLTVDVNGRPVRGEKYDGTRWEAIGGVLTQIGTSLAYNSTGLKTVSDLTVSGAFVPPVTSGVGFAGPLQDFWRELWIDANNKPVYGVKRDGSQWEAQGGVMVQLTGSSLPVANSYSFDTATATALLSETALTDFMIIHNGQSWAEGASHDAGDATVTTAAQHAGYALMFDVGTRPGGAAVNAYADLKEAERGATSYETSLSGMADVIMRGLQTRLGRKPRIVFAIAAAGGQPYSNLKRGSASYTESLRLIARAAEISRAAGRKLVVLAQTVAHGEQDFTDGLSRSLYGRALDQWIEHMNDDIRAITGQTRPVRMYVSQVQRGGTSAGQPAEPALAQLYAMDRNPLIRCVGPAYQSPGSLDGAHLLAVGWRMLGCVFGYGILEDMFGPYSEPLRVVESWWASSTVFRLRYNKPIALETDDSKITISTLTPVAGKGVNFMDDAAEISITGVSVVSGNILEVTLATAPVSFRKKAFIAFKRGGGGSSSGNVGGCRSGIRASTAFFTDALTGRVLYQWATHDEIRL